jgi:predicted secreted protein
LRSNKCADYGIDEVFIFTLDLVHAGGGRLVTLQHDGQLPNSRVCPTDYRIERIVVFSPDQANETLCCAETYSMLVLIAMQQSPGFEGPDYRYLGVSGIVPLMY